MEFQLPETTLLRIFSFLDAFSLLQVGQVNKYWNEVAENDHLWRTLCLSKWGLPSSYYQCPSLPTWKQFFFHHMKRERQMAWAKPEDFVYREGAGLLGNMAYMSEGCQPMEEQERSLLCTVSSRRRLYVWDVQEGTLVWSSPVQQFSIKLLATLPQLHLVFTVDTQETLKVWNCQHRDALAQLSMPRFCFSMDALVAKEGPFLMVGESNGNICTLTVPGLRLVSLIKAFNHGLDFLRCSSDARWVLAAGMDQCVMPQVFLVECLLRVGAHRSLLFAPLSVWGCCMACWALKRTNRVTLMFRGAPSTKTGFATFDVTTEKIRDQDVVQAHQVASFSLPIHMENPICMGVLDGTVIIFDNGPQLLLVTISGHLLQRFQDHQLSICHLWVGPLYVLTTSMDNYLCLYMWEDKGHHPYLKRCCRLEHRRGDQAPKCHISKAICDNVSVACVVSRNRESSVMVMYSLHV